MSYEPFDFHPSTDLGWRIHCAWIWEDNLTQQTDPIAGWMVQIWVGDGDRGEPTDVNSRRIEAAFIQDGSLTTVTADRQEGLSNTYYWLLKPGEEAPTAEAARAQVESHIEFNERMEKLREKREMALNKRP